MKSTKLPNGKYVAQCISEITEYNSSGCAWNRRAITYLKRNINTGICYVVDDVNDATQLSREVLCDRIIESYETQGEF